MTRFNSVVTTQVAKRLFCNVDSPVIQKVWRVKEKYNMRTLDKGYKRTKKKRKKMDTKKEKSVILLKNTMWLLWIRTYHSPTAKTEKAFLLKQQHHSQLDIRYCPYISYVVTSGCISIDWKKYIICFSPRFNFFGIKSYQHNSPFKVSTVEKFGKSSFSRKMGTWLKYYNRTFHANKLEDGPILKGVTFTGSFNQ